MTTSEILRRPYARVLIPEADGRFSAEIMQIFARSAWNFPAALLSATTHLAH
jgi:hypothetical protein